ncbi:MAG: glycerol-3-phosphate dehydrogenase/oxidase, partial [Gammaproteobacteria bacterium]
PAVLAAETWDVVIIGGGITGAGAARHAAQAGLRTLVLEADDFAAGTSSRSTKLIHGGLRYLAMGDIALVREGALERRSLLTMAPHLTDPRWMLVPARSRLEYLKLRLGISLYEWLGRVPRAARHRNLAGDALTAAEPGLDARRTPWACLYREYQTDDARLVLATLRAAARSGAVVCNHIPVTGLLHSADGCRITATDLRTNASITVSARAAVNAAGPWVESLLARANAGQRGSGSQGRALHLSKGVHVVVPHVRLPVRNMIMMTAADGRPVFAIERDGVTYVGTTDTSHTGNPTVWPSVEADDVAYLLATANAHFPDARLEPRDVIATWAGLRPLIQQPGKSPREMSRRDEIWRDGPLVTIAGGKLTGFRRMAEQTMAAVGAVLGRSVTLSEPLATLPGGERADIDQLLEDIAVRYQLQPQVARRLARLYGSETFTVLGPHPVPLSPSTFEQEVVWALDVEGAETLADVIYRRLRTAWYLPDECRESLDAVVGLIADRKGWSAERRARERATAIARLDDDLAAPARAEMDAQSGASR